jgi:hypothetical protein
MNIIQGLIENIDIINKEPAMLIKGSRRFKTVFGGVISFLTLGFISAAIGIFFSDFLHRESAAIIFNQSFHPYQKWNFTGLPIMFMIQDVNFQPIRNASRYWVSQAEMWNVKPIVNADGSSTKTTRTPVKFSYCDINLHFGNLSHLFSDVPYLTDHFCILPNENIPIYGAYGGISEYNYLNLYFLKCVGDHSCESTENVISTLGNVRLSIKFPDYWIDHKNLSQPQQQIINANTMQVTSSTFKRFWYYLKTVNYTSDIGYIFRDSAVDSFFQSKDPIETVDLRANQTVSNSFCQFSILMDKTADSYNRTFQKIQSVIANCGGLIKAMLVISIIINHIFFCELYFIELIKTVFFTQKSQLNVIHNGERSKVFFSNIHPGAYNKNAINSVCREESGLIQGDKQDVVLRNNYMKKTGDNHMSNLQDQHCNTESDIPFKKINATSKLKLPKKPPLPQKKDSPPLQTQNVQMKSSPKIETLSGSLNDNKIMINFNFDTPQLEKINQKFLSYVPYGYIYCQYRHKRGRSNYEFFKNKIIKLLDIKLILKSIHEYETKGK